MEKLGIREALAVDSNSRIGSSRGRYHSEVDARNTRRKGVLLRRCGIVA